MLKKYIFGILIFISGFSFAQEQEKPIIPHIRLKTDSKKDHIALRWAVDEPLAWQKANKTGFQLKRYTLMRDGKLLPKPEEKDLGIFLPAPEKEWQKGTDKGSTKAGLAQFEAEMSEVQ